MLLVLAVNLYEYFCYALHIINKFYYIDFEMDAHAAANANATLRRN